MKDPQTGWIEADVTINGQPLTFAQAMCLRVAVTSFRMSFSNPDTRRMIGENLSRGYDTHLRAVELLMMDAQDRGDHDGA